ncbi:MAG: FKBP-type peptidyl-prolyl cis-trans isomerase [Taibaiella sp.]|nr:FKBP-type peptidyl-prolyl cis-trans isomerase [Taibaiella sp.]
MKSKLIKALVPMAVAMGMTTFATAQDNAGKTKDGFSVLPSGLQYKIIKKGNGTHKAQVSDHAEMFIRVSLEDSLIFDSRKMFNPDKPVPVTIQQPKTQGDHLYEGFMLLSAGDSAQFKVPVDSVVKAGGPQMPGMKLGVGQMMNYEVQVVTIRTAEEEKKYNDEMAAKQTGIDEALLQDYFKKNGIKAKKTASGLYYSVKNEGTGPKAKAGQEVSVMYTGKLIDGNTFDSNEDPAFKHPEPFRLILGKGQVIKGWDEGLQLFSKGAKGTLYIPSALAYGSQDRSPTIPPNSILIFDVEIKDIVVQMTAEEQAKKDDQLISDYLKKNKIKATKTASGLYYSVSKKGEGPMMQAGKKVNMNYTGKTLDGSKFDSNVDPDFHHVQPFEFTLGQGQVIKGWDEGIQLLQKGSKGTLYIPSGLAYGAQSPSPKIPANSVLVFDVEVVGSE